MEWRISLALMTSQTWELNCHLLQQTMMQLYKINSNLQVWNKILVDLILIYLWFDKWGYEFAAMKLFYFHHINYHFYISFNELIQINDDENFNCWILDSLMVYCEHSYEYSYKKLQFESQICPWNYCHYSIFFISYIWIVKMKNGKGWR